MLALVSFCVVLLIWWFNTIRKTSESPPGPKPWPLIGSLHLLGQHTTPFQAFTALSRIYGDIFSINLGSMPCVVVNNFALIKEVLITKGADFGGRPDFIRFHKLFGGDRNNCKFIIYDRIKPGSCTNTKMFPFYTPVEISMKLFNIYT